MMFWKLLKVGIFIIVGVLIVTAMAIAPDNSAGNKASPQPQHSAPQSGKNFNF